MPALHFTAAPDAQEALAEMHAAIPMPGRKSATSWWRWRRRLHAADPAYLSGKGKPIYGMNVGSVGS